MQKKVMGERDSTAPWLTLIFSLVVAVYCIWILSLPVFPSQDGPLHLYYISIFGQFLAHSPGVYAKYYRVGSYLPPYALYYYLVLALHEVMAFTTADKVLVCCSLVLNAFGFRYLARHMGRGGSLAAILYLPVLMNWPIAMGFLNFTLSSGLGWWAGGLWARFGRDHTWARQIGFVVLMYLMMLTHPIPLAVLLVSCGVDLVIRFVRLSRAGQHWRILWGRAFCLVAAVPSVFYIRSFTVKNILSQQEETGGIRYVRDAATFLHGAGLTIFPVDTFWAIFYRAGVSLLVLATLAVAGMHARRCWKEGKLDTASLWFFASLVAAFCLPLIPRELNGSHYLARRLAIVAYSYIALGVAGIGVEARRTRFGLVAASVLLSSVAFSLAAVRMGAAAHQIAKVMHDEQTVPGEVGAVVLSGPFRKAEFTYQPFYWAGVHYFREHKLILYNSAWLDGPQIPLKLASSPEILESTFAQAPPSVMVPSQDFLPGHQWNPARVSFFLLERWTPHLKAARQGSWQAAQPTIPNLDIGACEPTSWFCLAPRR